MRFLTRVSPPFAAVGFVVLLASGLPANSATAQVPSFAARVDSVVTIHAAGADAVPVDSVSEGSSAVKSELKTASELKDMKKQEIRKPIKPTKFFLLQQKLGISEEKLRAVTKCLEEHKRSARNTNAP